MLDAMVRCSRHRWTVLKLPPRRVERRLTSAARWFAELLSRHPVRGVDVVFVSDAMALTDLLHYVPALLDVPAVAYFHDNHLPPPGVSGEDELGLINLQTASVATEAWFNSTFHLKTFLARAGAAAKRSNDPAVHNLLSGLMRKLQVVHPPMDLALIQRVSAAYTGEHDPYMIFADLRGGGAGVLGEALRQLTPTCEGIELASVGNGEIPADGLLQRTIPGADEIAQVHAMRKAGVVVGTRTDALYDPQAVWAMAVGCWPVLPAAGFYPELVPESLHDACLYDGTANGLAEKLSAFWRRRDRAVGREMAKSLRSFDALTACRDIDARLEKLAEHGTTLRPGVVGTLQLDLSPLELRV
jgi:hypothetical protein